MARVVSILRRVLPRRRRRLWRYVSGRRRGVGAVLLLGLVLIAFVYWSFTNDARVKQEAVLYLERLTGGRVKIDRAHFSLFEGIQVWGLRVYLPGEDDVAFLDAPEVLLRHSPHALFVRRRIKPAEIVCVGPVVRLVEDVASGRQNYMKLFPLEGSVAASAVAPASLPTVRIREGKLIRMDRDARQLVEIRRWEDVSVSLSPDEQQHVCRIRINTGAGQGRPLYGEATINTLNGQLHVEELSGGLVDLDDALPRRYRQFRQRYGLAGKLTLTGTPPVGTATRPESAPAETPLTLTLEDVSMTLPADQGGVRLVGVHGRLIFHRERVEIVRLQGRMNDPTGPSVSVTGQYEGYDPSSPFRLSVSVEDLALPLSKELAEVWGADYARLHEQLKLTGPMDVKVEVWRGGDAKIHATGVGTFKGVGLTLPDRPITVVNITGAVGLTGETVTLDALTGEYGSARMRVDGRLFGQFSRPGYDIRLAVRDMPFVEDVRAALGEEGRRIWRDFAPAGRANVDLHARRPGEEDAKDIFDATITFTGGASLTYRRFPYPLHKVTGEVVLGPGRVDILRLRGENAPVTCEMNGRVDHGEDGWNVEVVLNVADMPLDERLAEAMGPRSRAVYLACGLGGRADVSKGIVRQVRSGPVQIELPVTFRDARIVHKRFPWAIEQATGELTVTEDRVDIHHLAGRHGQARITLTGRASMDEEGERTEINADATAVALDEDLRKALPSEARRWWAQIEPSGQADATVQLRVVETAVAKKEGPQIDGQSPSEGTPPPTTGPATAPVADPQLDYVIRVAPRDARIRYRHFPVVLRKVGGRIEIRPDVVLLKGITATAGAAAVAVDGSVTGDLGDERADLSISTGPIVVDEAFLAALPSGIVEVLGLHPGGTIALDLTSLRIRRSEATTRPAATGGDGPANLRLPEGAVPTTARGSDQCAEAPLAWSWEGSVSLADAEMDLGFGAGRLTGQVTGKFGSDGPAEKMDADAEVALKSMLIGSRPVGKLSAAIKKTAASPVLRLDKITADAFGGSVAGFAELALGENRRYGLSLSVENVDLTSFLNAGRTDPKDKLDVKGLLTGNLQLTADMKDPSSRRATGSFSIAKGKLYRLPVVLSFLQVIFLQLPGDAAYDTAEVEYYLKGEKLVFREIHLQGAAGSMVGAGTADLSSGKLKLTFLTGPPRKLPRLEALSEFIEGLASGLGTVRVTGTLGKPVMRTAPLREPGQTLRELYAPEEQ